MTLAQALEMYKFNETVLLKKVNGEIKILKSEGANPSDMQKEVSVYPLTGCTMAIEIRG